jgi:hypothetical protein
MERLYSDLLCEGAIVLEIRRSKPFGPRTTVEWFKDCATIALRIQITILTYSFRTL